MARREEVDYRKVVIHGETLIEQRYKGDAWTGWLFETSKEPRKYWRYIPEFGLYKSNISTDKYPAYKRLIQEGETKDVFRSEKAFRF